MFHFPLQQFIDSVGKVWAPDKLLFQATLLFLYPNSPQKFIAAWVFSSTEKKNQILDLILLTDNEHIYLWLPECLRKITGRKLFFTYSTISQAALSFLFLLFQISLQMHYKDPFMHGIFSTFPLLLSSSLCSTCPQRQNLYKQQPKFIYINYIYILYIYNFMYIFYKFIFLRL